MSKIGVYPGSFNPPTTAHVAIASAAIEAHGLDSLVIILSQNPLGKQNQRPILKDRLAVVSESFAGFDSVEVRSTNLRLLSDISKGYDVLVIGGDKWQQVQELRWYGNAAHRSDSLAQLPQLAIAARNGVVLPSGTQLDLPAGHVSEISSTAARRGARHMMTAEALRFAELSGAWLEPARYERWRGEQDIPT